MVERRIGGTLGLDRVGVGGEAPGEHRLGIGHHQHAVDGQPGPHLGPVEGGDQRLGQRQARGLDHDVVGRRVAGEDRAHGGQEIVGHRAADAAVGELDHVLLGAALDAAAAEHGAVDAEVAELVDQQRQPPPAGVLDQVADQAGLARTQKAGDDRGRDPGAHRRSACRRRPAVKAATAGPGQRVVSRSRPSSRSPAALAAAGSGRASRRAAAAGRVEGAGVQRRPARRGSALDTRQPRGAAEKAPIRPEGSGSETGSRIAASTGAPRPAHRGGPSDGRSPGSRLDASLRLPGQAPSGTVGAGSPPTVAGAAPELGRNPYRLPFQVPKDTVASLGIMRTRGRQAARGRRGAGSFRNMPPDSGRPGDSGAEFDCAIWTVRTHTAGLVSCRSAQRIAPVGSCRGRSRPK